MVGSWRLSGSGSPSLTARLAGPWLVVKRSGSAANSSRQATEQNHQTMPSRCRCGRSRRGWSAQLVHFLNGMAATDTLNAALALVFVYGYFTLRPVTRLAGLGTLTLTVSMYAAAVFTYGTVAVGAWTTHLVAISPVPALPAGSRAVWLVVCSFRARRERSAGKPEAVR